jgi:hypothetical protein
MPPFAVEAQRAPSHRTEKSLLATVAAIAVGTVLIVWFSMQIATVEILEHEATTRARNWAHCISNDVEDIKRFLAGDSTTPHDFQVLNTAENVGDVFSYRILGPDGTVNLASNPGSVGTTVNTAFFPDIVSPGGNLYTDRVQRRNRGHPRSLWRSFHAVYIGRQFYRCDKHLCQRVQPCHEHIAQIPDCPDRPRRNLQYFLHGAGISLFPSDEKTAGLSDRPGRKRNQPPEPGRFHAISD